jgi:hypothetical protein
MYEVFLNLSDYVGMLGVILILIAYFGLSMGRLMSDTMTYQTLNCLGAWLILFSLYFHWNLSSVVIEVAWIIISFMGIWRLKKNGCKKKAS